MRSEMRKTIAQIIQKNVRYDPQQCGDHLSGIAIAAEDIITFLESGHKPPAGDEMTDPLRDQIVDIVIREITGDVIMAEWITDEILVLVDAHIRQYQDAFTGAGKNADFLEERIRELEKQRDELGAIAYDRGERIAELEEQLRTAHATIRNAQRTIIDLTRASETRISELEAELRTANRLTIGALKR